MKSETLHFHCPFENVLCCAVIVKAEYASGQPTMVVVKKIDPSGSVTEHFKYMPNDPFTSPAEDLVALKILNMNHWNYITPGSFQRMLPAPVGESVVYKNE